VAVQSVPEAVNVTVPVAVLGSPDAVRVTACPYVVDVGLADAVRDVGWPLTGNDWVVPSAAANCDPTATCATRLHVPLPTNDTVKPSEPTVQAPEPETDFVPSPFVATEATKLPPMAPDAGRFEIVGVVGVARKVSGVMTTDPFPLLAPARLDWLVPPLNDPPPPPPSDPDVEEPPPPPL
jgi:hypothetical protein